MTIMYIWWITLYSRCILLHYLHDIFLAAFNYILHCPLLQSIVIVPMYKIYIICRICIFIGIPLTCSSICYQCYVFFFLLNESFFFVYHFPQKCNFDDFTKTFPLENALLIFLMYECFMLWHVYIIYT